MTKSTHTPGPWVIGNRHTSCGVYTPDGELIANTHSSQRNFDRDEQIAEQDANAHLIAAAPDLLDALLEIREDCVARSSQNGVMPIGRLAWYMLETAIAKASGDT